jgi:hypothetical protein
MAIAVLVAIPTVPLWPAAPDVFERVRGIVMTTKMMGRVP